MSSLTGLSTLAEASSATITYLRSLGDNGQKAQAEYDFIRQNEDLFAYYIAFVKSMTGTVIACMSISSNMVGDTRITTGEKFMKSIDYLANTSGVVGAAMITGIGSYLLTLVNDRERKAAVDRVTSTFPTVASHVFIQILARELTLKQQREIVACKFSTRQNIFDKAKKSITWLQLSSTKSSIEVYADGQAARLLDNIMKTDPATTVDSIDHLDRLFLWATGLSEKPGVSTLISTVQSYETLSNVKQPEDETSFSEKQRVIDLEDQFKEMKSQNQAAAQMMKELEKKNKELEEKVKKESSVSSVFHDIMDSSGQVHSRGKEEFRNAANAYLKGETPWHKKIEKEILKSDEAFREIAPTISAAERNMSLSERNEEFRSSCFEFDTTVNFIKAMADDEFGKGKHKIVRQERWGISIPFSRKFVLEKELWGVSKVKPKTVTGAKILHTLTLCNLDGRYEPYELHEKLNKFVEESNRKFYI